MVTNYIRDKQQIVQNIALRITTGCTRDTSTQHLHEETSILPIKQHLALHASQLRQKAQHPEHTLHQLTLQPHQPRNVKQTIFHNTNYTTNRDTIPDTTTLQTVKNDMKRKHTEIVQSRLQTRTNNTVINGTSPKINAQEQTRPRYTRRTLAQLRANKCLLLIEYLHKISPDTHPTPMCPLYNAHTHNTNHLSTCQHRATHYTKTYISLGKPGGGGGGLLFPLVCGSGVGAGSTVRWAARPRQTGGVVDTTTAYFSINEVVNRKEPQK